MRYATSLLFFVLFLSRDIGHAQATSEKLLPPTQTASAQSLNSALVRMARDSQVNFIADATQFSSSETLGVVATGDLKQNLAQFAGKHELTWFDRKPLLLLWTQPDIRQMAQMMKNGQKIKLIVPVSIPKVNSPTKPDNTGATVAPTDDANLLEKAILNYLKERNLWNATKGKVSKEVKVSDLAPDLHDSVVAAVQTAILQPQSLPIYEVWFQDKFWNNAQLSVIEKSTGEPNGSKIPVIVIGGGVSIGSSHGGTMMSLGALLRTKNN